MGVGDGSHDPILPASNTPPFTNQPANKERSLLKNCTDQPPPALSRVGEQKVDLRMHVEDSQWSNMFKSLCERQAVTGFFPEQKQRQAQKLIIAGADSKTHQPGNPTFCSSLGKVTCGIATSLLRH